MDPQWNAYRGLHAKQARMAAGSTASAGSGADGGGAGADGDGDSSVGKPGSDNYIFERDTWPELERLARDLPEAGVHFQGRWGLVATKEMRNVACRWADCQAPESHVYRRAKDKGTATAEWFEELMRPDAWFRDVVPKVCQPPTTHIPLKIIYQKPMH